MIINLIKLIFFVFKHPSNRESKFSALLRVLRWQIGSRLIPSFIMLPYYNNTYLLAKKGMTSATLAWYCGLYGFDEEELHQKLLSCGFRTYSYIPSTKKLINLSGQKNSNKNTLYLRENFKND